MSRSTRLVFGGHSIPYGYGTGPGIAGRVTQPYPSQVLPLLGSPAYLKSHYQQDQVVNGPVNVAIGGRLISDCLVTEWEVWRPDIACWDIGTNDITGGGAGMSNATADALAASMVAAVAAKCTAILATSPTVRIIVGTIVTSGIWDAGQQRARAGYNTSVLAGGLGNASRVTVCDPTVDSRLQTPSNATYFQADLLHFNNTGYGVHAIYWAAAIKASRALLP